LQGDPEPEKREIGRNGAEDIVSWSYSDLPNTLQGRCTLLLEVGGSEAHLFFLILL
jgi:hypothetical protein